MQPTRPPSGDSRDSRYRPHGFDQLPPPLSGVTSPRHLPPPSLANVSEAPPAGITDPSSWATTRSSSATQPPPLWSDRPSSRRAWSHAVEGVYVPRDREQRPPSSQTQRSWSPPRPGTSYSDYPSRLAPLEDYPRPIPWENPTSPIHRTDFRTYGQPSPSTQAPRVTPQRTSPRRTSSPGPSTSRQADSPDTDNPKKKKRRVALSCAECAKRKQKCNREIPCSHCIARRVPELCVPYTRPASPKRETSTSRSDRPQSSSMGTDAPKAPALLPTLSVRVGRLEAVVNALITRVGGMESRALDEWRINHPPATSPPPLDRTQLELDLASSAASPGFTEVQENPEARTRSESAQDIQATPRPERIRVEINQSAAKSLEERGIPPNALPNLLSSSRSIDNIRQSLQKYDDLHWMDVSSGRKEALVNVVDQLAASSEDIDTEALCILPLLLASLALVPAESPSSGGAAANETYLYLARTATVFVESLGLESPELVEARLLIAMATLENNGSQLEQAWILSRTSTAAAQCIGIGDSRLLSTTSRVPDVRGTLWIDILYHDSMLSILVGRPLGVGRSLVEKNLPSPRSTMSSTAQIRALRGRVVLIAMEVSSVADGDLGLYEEVERIDRDLQKCLDIVLRLNGEDKGDRRVKEIGRDLAYLKIVLHVQWLLRKLKKKDHGLSRTSSDEALLIFAQMVPQQEDSISWEGIRGRARLQLLDLAVVALLLLIIEPTTHSLKLKEIVDVVLGAHPERSSLEGQFPRHIEIIRLLSRRQQQIAESPTKSEKKLSPSSSGSRSGSRQNPRRSSSTTDKGKAEDKAQSLFNHCWQNRRAPRIITVPVGSDDRPGDKADDDQRVLARWDAVVDALIVEISG